MHIYCENDSIRIKTQWFLKFCSIQREIKKNRNSVYSRVKRAIYSTIIRWHRDSACSRSEYIVLCPYLSPIAALTSSAPKKLCPFSQHQANPGSFLPRLTHQHLEKPGFDRLALQSQVQFMSSLYCNTQLTECKMQNELSSLQLDPANKIIITHSCLSKEL